MIMSNLKSLHESMQSQLDAHNEPIEHQSFRSKHGGAVFECIFSTSMTPYKLSLTSRGTAAHQKAEFFLFDVSPENYSIPNYLGPDYDRLVKLLKTRNGMSGVKLIPADFLEELNSNTPTHATIQAVPPTSRIIQCRLDITEDRDKPFFSHWRTPNCKNDGSKGSVSEENRKKTATISSAALAYSDQIGKSSCWSPTPTHADWRPGK